MAYDNLIIRARSITKSYGTEKVLSDFNLDVWNGAIVGILGVSGSGKTTALRLIAGFEKPDSGIIEMRNEIIANEEIYFCLLYTSPSPRDLSTSRMPSSA